MTTLRTLCRYRKVGGIHFISLGRLGFSFYLRRRSRSKLVGR